VAGDAKRSTARSSSRAVLFACRIGGRDLETQVVDSHLV
jgi:hypothetical protein